MRRKSRLLGLMSAGGIGVIAAGIVALSQPAAATPRPGLSERQILRMALGVAARSGDPRPTLTQHSEGPHGKANQLTSAATGRVTDGGLSYRYPPLARLGPVTTDFRSYAACRSDGRRQLTSSATGAAHHLVPEGARQVLLCRYQGLNPRPSDQGQLLAQRLIGDARTVHELTREFDALPRLPNGSFSCPADFGVRIVAIFRYRPSLSSDDPVTVDPGGCAPVMNGHVARTAIFPAGQRLVAQLAGLTGMAVMNAR